MRIALLLLIVGCSTSKTAEHDLHAAQQEDLAATEHLRLDAEEHAQIDEHLVDTTEPGGELFEWYGPDGGVTARRERFWGERKVEDWQTRSMGSDEHLDLDAGVTVRTSGTLDKHDKSDKEMKPSGGCMLGLGFYGAIALAGVCAAAGLYLKLKAKAAKALP